MKVTVVARLRISHNLIHWGGIDPTVFKKDGEVDIEPGSSLQLLIRRYVAFGGCTLSLIAYDDSKNIFILESRMESTEKDYIKFLQENGWVLIEEGASHYPEIDFSPK